MATEINTTARATAKHRRAIGPVTLAVRTMRAAHDDRGELQALRASIAARIAADVALLEVLGR